jgi:ankyrin repeat protein
VISLCRAIEKRDVAEIERVVKSGVNINTKGRGNMTPLLWAFPMGEGVFKKMLELGADPNVKLTERILPVAFEAGDSVTIACATHDIIDGLLHDGYFRGVPMDNYLKLVLKYGGNPNIVDAKGETPLFRLERSIPSKLPARIRLLLDAGADIDHRNWARRTPLLSGVGEADYLLCLLRGGADYRLVGSNGLDFILVLERLKMPQGPHGQVRSALDREVAQSRPVYDWLAKEGVNWEAARKALNSPETMANLKNLPADYKHRPWLPQRPTLKKPDAKAKRPIGCVQLFA